MIGIIDTDQKLSNAIALLESNDVNHRRVAAKALCTSINYGKVQSEPAIAALTNALSDQDGYVRERCAEAIGRAAKYLVLIPEHTIAVLRRSMRTDESQGVKEKAEQALIDCGKLQRKTTGSPDQLHLFTWSSMGEGYALLRRMQAAQTPATKPAARAARSVAASL